jgi:hypothetical protein
MDDAADAMDSLQPKIEQAKSRGHAFRHASQGDVCSGQITHDSKVSESDAVGRAAGVIARTASPFDTLVCPT